MPESTDHQVTSPGIAIQTSLIRNQDASTPVETKKRKRMERTDQSSNAARSNSILSRIYKGVSMTPKSHRRLLPPMTGGCYRLRRLLFVCPNGGVFNYDSCVCEGGVVCSSTEYYSGGACLPCVSPCLACYGPSATNCDSCVSGYTFGGTTCTQNNVVIPNCVTNEAPASCGLCVKNFQPVGTQNVDRTCQACPAG